MSMIQDKAREVNLILTPLNGLEGAEASPFIDFITQLMQQLLPLLINCIPKAQRKDPAVIAGILQSPNLRQRLGLRFQLRQTMDDPRTANLTASQIEDAMLTMGKGVTVDQAKTMVDEVA